MFLDALSLGCVKNIYDAYDWPKIERADPSFICKVQCSEMRRCFHLELNEERCVKVIKVLGFNEGDFLCFYPPLISI